MDSGLQSNNNKTVTNCWAALTYSAMQEQDILLQQIAESYLPAHAWLSNLTRPWTMPSLLASWSALGVAVITLPLYIVLALTVFFLFSFPGNAILQYTQTFSLILL